MARKDIEISYGNIFATRSRFSRVKKMFRSVSKSSALFSLFAVSSVLFYLILGITPNLNYSSIESDLLSSKTIATTSKSVLKDSTDFNAKKEAVVEEKTEEVVEEPKTMAKVELPKKTDLESPKESYAGQPVYTAPARSYAAPSYANYINLAGRILPIYQNCTFGLNDYDTYVANCEGGYGSRYANFYYAHNYSNVFGSLLYMSEGQTFAIVKNGIVHNYRIAKKLPQSVSELKAKDWLRDRMYRAEYSHSISLQTCIGDGKTEVLYVFADEI